MYGKYGIDIYLTLDSSLSLGLYVTCFINRFGKCIILKKVVDFDSINSIMILNERSSLSCSSDRICVITYISLTRNAKTI